MVNDIGLWMRNLEACLSEARSANTFGERAGIWAATRELVKDVAEHIESNEIGDPAYLGEKLTQLDWHVGALTGFDIDNRLPHDQHFTSGLGALSTLNRALGTD